VSLCLQADYSVTSLLVTAAHAYLALPLSYLHYTYTFIPVAKGSRFFVISLI